MTEHSFLILTSEFPPGPGGIGNHAFNLAKWLTTRGEKVEVWTAAVSDNYENENIFDREQPFPIVRYQKSGGKFNTYLKLIRNLKSRIRSNGETHVISSGMVPLIVGGILKFFYTKNHKFTAVVHGLDINPSDFITRNLVMFALRNYEKIIAVSNFTFSYLPENVRHKAVVINNGVDIEKFHQPENQLMNTPGTKPKGNPVLVTVGTVWKRKGQINVVRALPEILKRFPEAHYHIAGTPKESGQLMEEAVRVGVESSITLHGIISDEALITLLSGADIFLMLSTHTASGDFEGFGIAILEANMLGVPAIGSHNCGIEDAISDGNTGVLVDPFNPIQIADATENILNNYSEYAANAGKYARNCSWQNVINQYLTVLKD